MGQPLVDQCLRPSGDCCGRSGDDEYAGRGQYGIVIGAGDGQVGRARRLRNWCVRRERRVGQYS